MPRPLQTIPGFPNMMGRSGWCWDLLYENAQGLQIFLSHRVFEWAKANNFTHNGIYRRGLTLHVKKFLFTLKSAVLLSRGQIKTEQRPNWFPLGFQNLISQRASLSYERVLPRGKIPKIGDFWGQYDQELEVSFPVLVLGYFKLHISQKCFSLPPDVLAWDQICRTEANSRLYSYRALCFCAVFNFSCARGSSNNSYCKTVFRKLLSVKFKSKMYVPRTIDS